MASLMRDVDLFDNSLMAGLESISSVTDLKRGGALDERFQPRSTEVMSPRNVSHSQTNVRLMFRRTQTSPYQTRTLKCFWKTLVLFRWWNHQEHQPAVRRSRWTSEKSSSQHRPKRPDLLHPRISSADGDGQTTDRWEDRGGLSTRRIHNRSITEPSGFSGLISDGLYLFFSWCRPLEWEETAVLDSVLLPKDQLLLIRSEHVFRSHSRDLSEDDFQAERACF